MRSYLSIRCTLRYTLRCTFGYLAILVSASVQAQSTDPGLALLSEDFSAHPVRKSDRNICYTVRDSYYTNAGQERTFDSLNECFASGGRAPFNEAESIMAYSLFLSQNSDAALQACAQNVRQACQLHEDLILQRNALADEQNNLKEFAGFNFGIGIAPTFQSSQVIEDVVIDDNGIIRVKKASKNSAKLMLETHKFIRNFNCTWVICGKESDMGWGPFLAISLTDEEGADPLSTFGGGVMWGWKNPEEKSSWNIGIGAFINSEAQTLRDGFTDGMATTETDTANILKVRDESGWMLMFSATW